MDYVTFFSRQNLCINILQNKWIRDFTNTIFFNFLFYPINNFFSGKPSAHFIPNIKFSSVFFSNFFISKVTTFYQILRNYSANRHYFKNFTQFTLFVIPLYGLFFNIRFCIFLSIGAFQQTNNSLCWILNNRHTWESLSNNAI